MAARLIEVADSARDTRAAAEARGDHKTALSAGLAEARVLAMLAPLDALSEDIATNLVEAHDALKAMSTTVRQHPEVGEIIAAVLEQRGRVEWADHIRSLADDPNFGNEVSA